MRRIKVSALALVVGLFWCSQANAGPSSTGLIGYWTGDGTANDSSSTANNGTFTGSYVPGEFGSAFDLSTGGVTIPNNAAYANLGAGFSVGFWFNFNGHGGTGDIIGQDVGPGTNPKWFVDYNYQHPGAFEFHINGSSFAFLGSNTVSPVGWNQLTITKSGSTYDFYLNGNVIGSDTFTGAFPTPNAPLQFGINDGASAFSGLLDDVVLYDYALSPSEVAALATPASGIPAPGALALLGFGLVGVGRFRRRADTAYQ